MEVAPIGITQVDLKILSEFSKTHLGFSTIKNIDAAGYSSHVVRQYLAACDFGKTPIQSMVSDESNRSYLHFHISMAVHCHRDDYIELQTRLPLTFTCAEAEKRDHVVAIVTGTLEGWVDTCLTCLRPNRDGILREFGDCIYSIFKRMDLEIVFKNIRKQKNHEGKTIFPK